MADNQRAKEIIAEIVRASPGGSISSKTRLYKAFYFAHLYYAKDQPDYLSDWPIVRMPYGPGIDGSDELIREMADEGTINAVSRFDGGPFPSNEYRIAESKKTPSTLLSLEAISAIQKAVAFVQDKSSAELSTLTHERSRAWQEAADGEILDVYIDLMSDDEYERYKTRVDRIVTNLDAAWR